MIGKTMLFNPFTGAPRHPDDIKSDPSGLLVWDGEEPLYAADRASRLPEMGEGDWPKLPEPSDVIDYDSGPRNLFTADQLRAAQVAAVEKYKALVRGKA